MSDKLFRKNIEPSCSYCNHGSDIGGGEIVCIKKGVVREYDSCPKFSYDPFKRRPPEPKMLDLKGLSEEDFRL